MLLFPYVYYMAGVGAPCGDAAAFDGDAVSEIGACVTRMLKICSKADVDPLAQRRKTALQRKWRGDDVPIDELVPGFDNATNWDDITSQYSAIAKGPGTYHRTFAVAELLERNGWKSRKLTQLVRSSHAGSEEHGESIRIPSSCSAKSLGSRLIEHMRQW
ncbi:hypothetical protein Pla52n_44100 [Stieleria varia]|uniref:Uncharacterized protein n=1 Tax=Stieleria varia TaxID=2528005 RepID=A0A5C6AP38_9BACT|nr:hypothetical protein Pla52n_44100 [Stieleria varia]